MMEWFSVPTTFATFNTFHVSKYFMIVKGISYTRIFVASKRENNCKKSNQLTTTNKRKHTPYHTRTVFSFFKIIFIHWKSQSNYSYSFIMVFSSI